MLLLFCIVLAVLAIIANAESSAERASELLSKMSLDEKISLLHGSEMATNYIGYVKGNSRLGIPAIKMNDGPQGFRAPSYPGTTTAWPAMINLGATWDRDMCYEYGANMGEEFYNKGANIALGPGMNLARVPLNGRVFEYISGGDGYLGSMLVSPVIKGLQSNKIIANAKHWVNNNQETNRATVNEVVDERTRFELYYEPFTGAIEAGVGSFMCSYNKVNSLWSCENPETLSDLKKTLGFQGWVMSDWGATHSTSIEAGLDQEMPSGAYFGHSLKTKVTSGEISENNINASVLRILTPMYELGVMDDNNEHTIDENVQTPQHSQLARKIAAASHVLLQNNRNTLPLSKTYSSSDSASPPMKIALIGKMARQPIVGGGGSGEVYPASVITPYEGIMSALDMANQIIPLNINCNSTIHKNMGYEQSSCIQFGPHITLEECSTRCATFNGCTQWSFVGGHCIFAPTAHGLKPMPSATSGSCDKSQPEPSWQCNDKTNICLITTDGSDLDATKKIALEADVSILVIGTSCGEGNDRENLSFSRPKSGCQLEPEASQDILVSTIAPFSKRSIVAMTCPGACLTPWRTQVDTILHGFFPGQAYGAALADIIFGDVNPSAKLPLTMPNVENEVEFTPAMYPGVDKVATYSEQLLIDYRWYTANRVTPAFAFGHGLSYTTFGYNDLKEGSISPSSSSSSTSTVSSAARVTLTCTVTNTGSVAGSEVVQLYLTFPSEANTPPLQLKGFAKTSLLQAGSQQVISFTLRDRDLSVWDTNLHAFRVIPGVFIAQVGGSSADLKITTSFTVTA